MSNAGINCGEALIALLEQRGVELVFGIPGVHTFELYRGLAGSSIRHVGAATSRAPRSWPTASAGQRAAGRVPADHRPG